MASILDLLNTKMGEDFIKEVSQRTSESEDKIATALGIALPVLLGSMKNNISTHEGMEALNNALAEEKHYKTLTNKPPGFNLTQTDSEREKIVEHILGPERDKIISTLGTTVGIQESSVSGLLKMTAPLLMGILSSQKNKENLKASDLDELIQSNLGISSKFEKSLIDTFFIRNKDGSIIDDVDEKVLRGKKGKKGGSMLGGMTGGK